MKTNKLVAFVALVLVLTLFASQMLASTPSLAAPLAADGITATLSQPTSDQPNDQAPALLTVQGRLTTPGGQPVTTAVNLTFKLYNFSSGGTLLYTEPTVSITPDANGLFTYTDLGDGSADFINIFSVPLWVGITVGTDPEMTPRIRLNAAPYALSLAPGAITAGSFDPPSGSAQLGMVSVFNNSYSSTAAAGLYGRGRIGVVGSSNDQGTDTNSNSAGSFTNSSNNPGVHTGIIAQAFGTGGIGGVFTGTINSASGSGVVATGRTGIKVTASGSGSGHGYGGYFDNNGGSSGFQYGIQALNTSTGGTLGYGGYFDNAGGGSSYQYGIRALNTSTGGTNGYGGNFFNAGGGSGVQYGIEASNTSTGGTIGYGGSFSNNGGGSGDQYGIEASTNSTGGAIGYGGFFDNTGGGSGTQYGIRANTTSTGGGNGYGGYFLNNGGGSGTQYGILATTNSTSANSSYAGYFYNNANLGSSGTKYGVYGFGRDYSGYFASSSDTGISVYAVDAVSAQSFIDRLGAYSIMVRYNGTAPVQAGDVLAMDGSNPTVDGTQYLGVSKATAANVNMAVGVAQQRMKRIESDRPSTDGKTEGKDVSWGVDQQATTFQPGDMIRVVVLGQVQMKVANASFGDRLTIASDGSFSKVAAGSDYIGKVASAPDKNGYSTVFVNFK